MFIVNYCFAQNNILKPLNVGDTVPLILFNKFLNGDKSVQLKDLKGKLIILDFWNTGCLACLKSFPKIDSLQKQFANKIQFVMITNQSLREVKALFSKPNMKTPDIPIVVEDVAFYNQLFPHEGDPLHVWIDTNGIVRAITDGHNATVSNIQKFLKGNSVQLSSRISKIQLTQNSLLEEGCNKLKDFIDSYSLFFVGLNDQTTDHRFRLIKNEGTNKLSKISVVNVPLLTLYSLAYSKELFGVDINIRNLQINNRIIIETKNPLDIRYAGADSLLDEWNSRNLISYEASVNPKGGFDLLKVLQQDLDRHTSFSATLEEKEMNCLVLIRTSNKEKFKVKNSNAVPYSVYQNTYSIVNKPLQTSLIPDLIIGNQTRAAPITDETGLFTPVDMQINSKLNDLKLLRDELKKYDLDLIPAIRTIKMLIIRDKKA
jgi:thiol-disulfide isomerase/thioredoxin